MERRSSSIDDIIEKFNIRYANANKEISDIITTLSSDSVLVSNVRDSSQNAYEAAITERVISSITKGVLDGSMVGDTDRVSFFAELSNN